MRNTSILDALLPRTRQNILTALLLAPERRWYLSDLAQYLHVRPSSLQREMASLTDAGILQREADGNRVYYRTNTLSPVLPELQGLFAKTAGVAGKVRAALQPFWDEITLGFLFGSTASGEQTAYSDIDLLIVGSVDGVALALPLRELERTLQMPVNVMRYTAAEFREKQPGHFLQTLLRAPKIFLKGSDDELADLADKSALEDSHDEQAGD